MRIDLVEVTDLLITGIFMVALIIFTLVMLKVSIEFLFDVESSRHKIFMTGCMTRYQITDKNYDDMWSYCEHEYKERYGLRH